MTRASKSTLAARHKHATGCSYAEAASLHDITVGPVAREYKILYAGLVRERKDYVRKGRTARVNPTAMAERINGAVDFMIQYRTTAHWAAMVCSVPVEDVLRVWNARTGEERQVTG